MGNQQNNRNSLQQDLHAPEACGEDKLKDRTMTVAAETFRLTRLGDQILCHHDGADEPVAVRLSLARPLSHSQGKIVLLKAGKKEEVASLDGLAGLDNHSREIVQEELRKRYFLPKIIKVLSTSASFGNRYWHVVTDRGNKRFLMKSPETNVTWLTDDRCILRDTLGNCYEIESMKLLDRASQVHADRVL